MSADSRANLWLCLDRRMGPAARAWLERADAAPLREFALFFAAVPRRLGRGPVCLSATERVSLASRGLREPLREWRLDDLGRCVLLSGAARRLSGEDHEALVMDLYRLGGRSERRSILRALPILPEAPLFLPLALQASRDPDPLVFEAIACANYFPADNFPAHAFNELVLRARSMGLSLGRISGLEGRRSATLTHLSLLEAASR